MKIYVASKFENTAQVREAQALCREHGHEVTYDWTPHCDAVARGEHVDESRAAREDLDGVLAADAVVLLCHPGLKGGLVEVGAALAHGRTVAVVGDASAHGNDNVFFRLPLVERLTDLVDLADWLRAKSTVRIDGQF